MERLAIRIDRTDPDARALRGYFAEVFASLDAQPRRVELSVDAANDSRARVEIDCLGGDVVFRVEGRPEARTSFRGRWLAEHPVPLTFPASGRCHLILTPTTGNRVKVRCATVLERLFL